MVLLFGLLQKLRNFDTARKSESRSPFHISINELVSFSLVIRDVDVFAMPPLRLPLPARRFLPLRPRCFGERFTSQRIRITHCFEVRFPPTSPSRLLELLSHLDHALLFQADFPSSDCNQRNVKGYLLLFDGGLFHGSYKCICTHSWAYNARLRFQ